jgi:hypothetical protein
MTLLDQQFPSWLIFVVAGLFYLLQRRVQRWVRLWALITLPATVLHELAHGLVGWLLFAKPTAVSLWPKRMNQHQWQLGAVSFKNLTWWNGGIVALAPLLWILFFALVIKNSASVPSQLPLVWIIGLGLLTAWFALAFTPSSSDWRLALKYWLSTLFFIAVWSLLGFRLATGSWTL